MPVELLDSTSEIGRLVEKYMAHFAKSEIDTRHAALVAFFAKQDEEAKPAESRRITYSNIGKTPEAINAIRVMNQCDSAFLRLPAELLINIWEIAFGSTTTTRVHGIVSREIRENQILSLAHTCSLLHDVLYPTFLSQEAFVAKISSSDPSVAAAELTQWMDQRPYAPVLNGPLKLQILLELRAGSRPFDKARELAAEVQGICAASRTFQPVVYVETKIGWSWYFGSGANVQAWPPAAVCRDRVIGRPTGQDDVWKGWVVTKA